MRKNKFISGGIYQNSVPYKVPRSLSREDIINICEIFSFNMIRLLAMNLEINFQPTFCWRINFYFFFLICGFFLMFLNWFFLFFS